jgi:hypothetical protein
MKNKTQLVNRFNQTKILDWLYQEEEEDDFLTGITPKNLGDIGEEEE